MSINMDTKFAQLQPSSFNQLEQKDLKQDLGQKIHTISKLDPNTEISRSIWAVTMVTDKGSFHVRLVFEGIRKDLSSFFIYSHLQGPKTWRRPQAIFNCLFGWSKEANIEISRKIEHAKLKLEGYGKRSETWIRPREQIKLIINAIKAEKAKQDTHKILFSFFGKRSFLTKKAEFWETDNRELNQLKKSNPKRFEYLAELSETKSLTETKTLNCEDPEKKLLTTVQIIDRKRKLNRTLWYVYLLSMTFYMIKHMYIAGRAFKNKDLITGILTLYIGTFKLLPISVPFMMYNFFRVGFFDLSVNREQRFLELFNKEVKNVIKTPNSCYTWAEEKLLIIDVHLPKNFLDKLIAISTLYVNGKIERKSLSCDCV
jgi:hypothetical protein